MRSSDWSSDVCSSDLAFLEERKPHKNPRNSHFSLESTQASPCSCHLEKSQSAPLEMSHLEDSRGCVEPSPQRSADPAEALSWREGRSEERRVGKEGGSRCRSRGSSNH